MKYPKNKTHTTTETTTQSTFSKLALQRSKFCKNTTNFPAYNRLLAYRDSHSKPGPKPKPNTKAQPTPQRKGFVLKESVYSFLGISSSFTQSELRKRYLLLAAKHHPDKGGDTSYFIGLKQAYELLSDETMCSLYYNEGLEAVKLCSLIDISTLETLLNPIK